MAIDYTRRPKTPPPAEPTPPAAAPAAPGGAVLVHTAGRSRGDRPAAGRSEPAGRGSATCRTPRTCAAGRQRAAAHRCAAPPRRRSRVPADRLAGRRRRRLGVPAEGVADRCRAADLADQVRRQHRHHPDQPELVVRCADRTADRWVLQAAVRTAAAEGRRPGPRVPVRALGRVQGRRAGAREFLRVAGPAAVDPVGRRRPHRGR